MIVQSMRYTAIIDCPGSLILPLIFSHQSSSKIGEKRTFRWAYVRVCSHSAVLFNTFIEAKSFKNQSSIVKTCNHPQLELADAHGR